MPLRTVSAPPEEYVSASREHIESFQPTKTKSFLDTEPPKQRSGSISHSEDDDTNNNNISGDKNMQYQISNGSPHNGSPLMQSSPHNGSPLMQSMPAPGLQKDDNGQMRNMQGGQSIPNVYPNQRFPNQFVPTPYAYPRRVPVPMQTIQPMPPQSIQRILPNGQRVIVMQPQFMHPQFVQDPQYLYAMQQQQQQQYFLQQQQQMFQFQQQQQQQQQQQHFNQQGQNIQQNNEQESQRQPTQKPIKKIKGKDGIEYTLEEWKAIMSSNNNTREKIEPPVRPSAPGPEEERESNAEDVESLTKSINDISLENKEVTESVDKIKDDPVKLSDDEKKPIISDKDIVENDTNDSTNTKVGDIYIETNVVSNDTLQDTKAISELESIKSSIEENNESSLSLESPNNRQYSKQMIMKLKPANLPTPKFPIYIDNILVIINELGVRKKVEVSKYHNRPMGYWYDIGNNKVQDHRQQNSPQVRNTPRSGPLHVEKVNPNNMQGKPISRQSSGELQRMPSGQNLVGGGWIRGEKQKGAPAERKKLFETDASNQLVQTITGILNKITPDTYDKLSEQLCTIKINSSPNVKKVISVIFDTATQNKIFSHIYADLCSKLKSKSKEWTFLNRYVVKDYDTNDYLWISDMDLNDLSTSGPYESPDDCITAISPDGKFPEMEIFSVVENKLEFQENLLSLKAGILIKIYKHPNDKYYAHYKSMADINANFISQAVFKDISKAQKAAHANFKKLLIAECQERFFNIVDGTGEYGEYKELVKKHEIDKLSITSEKDLEQAEYDLEEIRIKLKIRKLGTIQFIGELFKLKILKAKLMFWVFQEILCEKDDSANFDSFALPLSSRKTLPDEDDLELLCELLSKIGDSLEKASTEDFAKEDFNDVFSLLHELSKQKEVSSRIKIKLELVIALRKNNWKARREDDGPCKKEDIHKKIANESNKGAPPRGILAPPIRMMQRGKGEPPMGQFNSQTEFRRMNSAPAQMEPIKNESKVLSFQTGVTVKRVNSLSSGTTINVPNANDNNNNINNNSNSNTDTKQSVEDDISDDKIEKKLKGMLSDYLKCKDMDEVCIPLQELPKRAIPRLIILVMDKYVDCNKSEDMTLLYKLLEDIGSKGMFSGLTELIEDTIFANWEPFQTLWEYVVDYVKAPVLIGDILKVLISNNACTKNAIKENINKIKRRLEEENDEYGPTMEDFDKVYNDLLNQIK